MAKKLFERSDRSREKLADSYINTGTTIHTATFITVFVTVLTPLVAVFLSRGELPALEVVKSANFLAWLIVWAIFGFSVAIIAGEYLKKKAMNIYDELFEKEQAKDRKARLTAEAEEKRKVLERLDDLERRLERIERRLDLREEVP